MDKNVDVVYTGNGTFSNAENTWNLESGITTKIPEKDYKFLVKTGQDSDIKLASEIEEAKFEAEQELEGVKLGREIAKDDDSE